MKPVFVESISVFGQGLLGWDHAKDVFLNPRRYDETLMPSIESALLTPNNKRRTTTHMHIAFLAAEHALHNTNIDKKSVHFVFTSSEGDLDIAHDNCMVLTHPEKEISPQKFQNVILNAAAGHLGVFWKNTAGSVSLTGHQNNFSVGLLEACSLLHAEAQNVLLVAYDAPSEMPYGPGKRPFFAMGLVLTKEESEKSLARLSVTLTSPASPTILELAALETIRQTTPAACGIPLLVAIAKKEQTTQLYYSNNLGLQVDL